MSILKKLKSVFNQTFQNKNDNKSARIPSFTKYTKIIEPSKKLGKVVSKEFLEIYEQFNVSSKIDKMKNLSKKELYLLICATLDNHDQDDEVVRLNLLEFKSEVESIYKMLNNEKHGIKELEELVKETCDRDINTSVILTENGDRLPKPKTRQEVREIRLNEIVK